MKKKLLLLSALSCIFFHLYSQTLDRNYVTTNGAVRAIVQQNDTVYIGGDFTQVGFQSKGIASFNAGSTKPDINFPQLGANSNVNAIEPDGSGGFYLAGDFKNFNGTIISNNTKILHVLNDGSLDASFNAVKTDGDILCMKKSGSNLYVGGAFINIQNTNLPYLAAIDAASGALINFTPAAPDNTVEKIDVSATKIFIQGSNITNIGGYDVPTHFGALRTSDGVYVNDFPTVNNTITGFTVSNNLLYVGGTFNQAGPSAVGVVKLSAADATVDPSFPQTNGMVMAILPDGSGSYYIGGNFTKVANRSRKNLAHILSDGTVDQAFNVTVDDQVLCLTSDANNVYLGGNFKTVNNTARNFAAAVSKSTGSLTTWNPAPDSTVLTMINVNNIIYMGGWFTSIKSTPRNFAAAVSTSNNLNTWAPEPNYYVNQIISNSKGTSFFLCGGFTTVKGNAHEYIAKLSKNGAVTAWRPKPDNVLKSIALSGNIIYMAGAFSNVKGVAKQYLAAADTSSNNPTSFSADLNNFPNNIYIAAGKLYVVGNYSQIQGKNISYISRVDISSGLVDTDDWNPVSNAYTGVVYSNGTDVIAGGNFTLMNGVQKNYMAAVNLNSNKFTSWSANGVASFNVNAISKILPADNDIFVGGDFSYFDGFNIVNNILVIDNSLGNISHLFSQYPIGNVSQLAVFDNKLMAGGNFSNVYDLNTASNVNRKNIAAYNQSDYMLSSSTYNANDTLNGMFTTASGNLIISGNFSLLNYVIRNYLAAISLSTKNVLPFNPSPDNTVNALGISNTTLFAGGTFKNIGSTSRTFIASINTNNGNANAWNVNCDSFVNTISITGNTIYFGGLFTTVKGTARTNAAAVSTTGGGTLKSWIPNPDDEVKVINATNGIYIGGAFSNIKTAARKYLAKTNTNGSANGWKPNPNKSVLSLTTDNTTVYIGGNKFTAISNKPRNALAAYFTSNNSITSFDAKLKYNNTAPQVNALAVDGNTLYVGSTALDSVNGVARGSLAAINTSNSNALAFNPMPDSAVLSLSASNNYLLAGGLWNSLGTNVSPSYFAVFALGGGKKESSPIVKNDLKNIKATVATSTIIYPNPARNNVTISFKKDIMNAKITLINFAGKVVWIKNNFYGKQLQFAVNNLAAGNYFVVVESEALNEELKLAVE